MNKRIETFMLLYVNSTEKWTGMKNTGLKMPETGKIRFMSKLDFHTISVLKL